MHDSTTTSSDEHDLPFDLADAFDAISSLHTTSSPLAAAGVVAAALEMVLQPDCISIYLYDVNDDVMRRVAGCPDDHVAHEIALGVGLVGRTLTVATEESRTFAGAELEQIAMDELAIADLEHAALLVRGVCGQGRLRAGIVISRAAPGSRMSSADVHVVDYIADRLGVALG